MFSLGVLLVSVYVSFFRPPDLYWTGKTDWGPGAPTSENQLSEPGRNGLSPCFRSQAESRNQRAEIGDCLLLIPSRTALHTYQVELRSGAFLLAETDLLLPGTPPIIFTRSFRAWDPRIWPWPIPPFNLYDLLPTGSRRPYTYVDLRFPDGQALHYPRISPGIGYQDAVYEHTGTRGPFYGSRLKWNGNGWALKLRNGTVYVFPEAYYARRHA